MLKSKTCRDCKVAKDLSEFYKLKNLARANCKECCKSISKEYNKNNKEKKLEWDRNFYKSKTLDHYVVYYLPEENYCGVTNNTNYRMRLHKSHGNNTNNWRVLSTTETLEEALTIESKYHTELGMNGASGWKKACEITK
tara:strand:+ start:480 stop:896 length:417 start_codon:yes stop_codon:yes gene_type:complete